MFLFEGLIDLPWWGYVLVALGMTHVTIAAVTIFLHRCQAHRALELHAIPSHFFRMWLWLTTGMVTKEWAAIHRKHHAKCETAEDPHSPQVYGIRKVLLEGAELYRIESRKAETMERYGHGTPDDWIERKLYSRYSAMGVAVMAVLDFALFGVNGIWIWAVQMLWIPFFAAGVINGLGHFWGYRHFETQDTSTNIFPWGILIGGEELHNNHHAYATSAKLSSAWYEFDIGWLYIRLLSMLGLARVKKLAPKLRLAEAKSVCDAETLQAVITHRHEVMATYARAMKGTWVAEVHTIRDHASAGKDLRKLKRLLHLDERRLTENERARLRETVGTSRVLATVHSMREELGQIWARSTATRDQLVRDLEDWCRRAESSGIAALEDFSRRLRCYAPS